jgi:TRAP-type C4-dicarboxylate transport system substrate-binding protein
MRSLIKSVAAGALVASTLALTGTSQAATTLTLSSWVPPTHPIVAGMIKPWIEQVEKETKGNVKIKILPKALGKPPAHFDLAKDGIADITYGVHGYQPGRFLLTKIVELPFLGDSAVATSVAYWRIYKRYLEKFDEHKGVKVLGLFTHGPGEIYNNVQPITTLDNLKGLKIRVGGGVVNDIAKGTGATVLLKPATKSHELLANGVADGVFFPKESIKSFKLTKLIKYATFIPGGLYNTSFFLAMNPKKFDALSAEDQDAIMRVSGENFARIAGKGWDDADTAGVAAMKAGNVEIINASKTLLREVKTVTDPIEAAWIKAASAKGLDAAAALKELRAEAKAVASGQ